MSTRRLVYAGLVALVVLAAGYGAVVLARRRARRSDRFSCAAPATPAARAAAGVLYEHLEHVGELCRQLESSYGRAAPGASPVAWEGTTPQATARLQAAQLAQTLGRVGRRLRGSPPTYANLLATYRGLAGADDSLRAAADWFYQLGVFVDVVHPPGSPEDVLTDLGTELHGLTRAVHALGVELEVE